MKRRTLHPLAMLWLPLLLGVACGGDTDRVRAPDPSNTLVGYLGAFSGTGAPGIDRRFAVQLAVEEVNAAGGVLGNALELVVADTEASANIGADVARDILDRFDVIGFVGPARSSVTLEVTQEVTIPAGLPLITGSATSPLITDLADDGLVFRTAPSDTLQGDVAATLVRERGIETASVLHIDDAYGRGLAASFAESFTEQGGRVLSVMAYPDLPDYSQFDFADTVLAALEAQPGMLYLVGFADDGAKVTRTIETLRLFGSVYRAQLVGADGLRNESFITNAAPTIVEGMIGTIPAADGDDPGFQAFVANFAARYGEEPSSRFAAAEYDALYLLALAAEQAGSTDPRRVAAELQAVSREGIEVGVNDFARASELIRMGVDVDYRGTTGDLALDSRGDLVVGAYEIWEVRGGQFVPIETRSSGS